MKYSMIFEKSSYTFADYFKLNLEVEDILTYFNYSFLVQNYTLPCRTDLSPERLDDLKARLEESLPYLSLTSEIARREFLIAPVLMELIHYTHAKIRVEYPIEVSDQLKGTLDYYVQAKHNLLVIEAKNADLQRGFTQLAIELVALDQWLEDSAILVYGAVSMGNIWQFGILDRQSKQIIQDLNLYRVPADLKELMGILVAILTAQDDH